MADDIACEPTDFDQSGIVADDLHCPVCDYALRGLPEPRCPECGYAFEWDELREQARRKTLWFYEHAGTFKSHRQTRLRSLWPFKFWREIHAYTDANPHRLTIYRSSTMVLCAIVMAPLIVALPYFYSAMRGLASQAGMNFSTVGLGSQPAHSWWMEQLARYFYFIRLPSFVPEIVAVPMVVVCAFGLGLYWRLLGTSVTRARIKPVHLARVSAYTADVLPALLLLTVIANQAWYIFGQNSEFVRTSDVLLKLMVNVLLVPLLVLGPLLFRTALALKRYVRFPQALAVAAGYYLIIGLIWALAVLSNLPLNQYP
ncbi:MAG: hypothetical protein JWM57_1878 [Phycisphaerales bacterium]|nr:hypothetical protein [Phycisphaerales bacterium]